MENPYRTVTLPDGRRLEYLVEGDPDGFPLVLHHGTPGAAVPFPVASAAAAERGLALVLYSRAGYGGSTPNPGRDVAAVAADMGRSWTPSAGTSSCRWAGRAADHTPLACAALLPERCRAAASGAGVAPYDTGGELDFLAGMGPENVEEFSAALAGLEALAPLLRREAAELTGVTPEQIAEAMGGLVSPVDKAYATGPVAARMLASFTHGCARRHRRLGRRRPGLHPRLGLRPRRDLRAGVDLAGRAGPHGAVRPRAVARRPTCPVRGCTCTTTRATCRCGASWTGSSTTSRTWPGSDPRHERGPPMLSAEEVPGRPVPRSRRVRRPVLGDRRLGRRRPAAARDPGAQGPRRPGAAGRPARAPAGCWTRTGSPRRWSGPRASGRTAPRRRSSQPTTGAGSCRRGRGRGRTGRAAGPALRQPLAVADVIAATGSSPGWT